MDEKFLEETPETTESTESAPKYQPKRGRFVMSKVSYYTLIVIFVAVFALSGIYIGGYFLETGKAEQDYDDLANLYEQGLQNQSTTSTGASAPSVPNGGSTSSRPVETQPPTILPELKAIYELNDDLVGYLNFDYKNLKLQYPVMQSPGNEDFYLNHDFYGNENLSGCLYAPTSCDVFKPSDNVVIYGHNMKTGGMFGKLTAYRDKSYWQTHQTFQFDTLYEHHTYQIFAVFKTAAKQYTADGTPWGYPYHRINEFSSKEDFDKFIADVKGDAFTSGGYKGWSFYDTGITPQYGDKLLCLSTCEYTMKDPDGTVNGRWVVIAVRID